MNGAQDKKMAAIPITVEPVTASLSAPDKGTAGGTLAVDWQGPGYQRDYIAVAEPGAKKYVTYAYVRGSGPTEIDLPDKPGSYELWYVMREGDVILARRPLVVE